jgi:hypothetical protein
MKNYTMMGASSISYDNSGVNPDINPVENKPAESTNTGSNDVSSDKGNGVDFIKTDYSTDDIPNTPDNIAKGYTQTSYAMIVAAIALAFIFLKKKKK